MLAITGSKGGSKVGSIPEYSTPVARQRIEQLRRSFLRWNRGERPVPLEEVHPDLELLTAFGSVSGEVYRGVDGLARWHSDISANFETFRVEPDAFHAIDDDTVVALLSVQLKGRESGLEMTQPFGWIIEFEGTRFRRLRTFTSHHETLRAAGSGL